jgi:hypothetical protein
MDYRWLLQIIQLLILVPLETQGRILAEQVIDMSRTINMKNTGLAVSVVTAIAVAVLVLLVITGAMNPQGFAIGCVVVMSVSAITWFILLKRGGGRTDSFNTTGASKVQSSDKTKYVRVAVLLLLLVASFWITRPWAPRLIGASVLVLVLIGTIVRKT